MATRVFGVQLLAVAAIAALLLVVLTLDSRQTVEDAAASTSLAVSRTIAADPAVQAALTSANPTSSLQPYALATIASAHVDFVTIMSPDGIRFTHPDAAQIGKHFLGDISAARTRKTLTETYTGTLGPSVRAVVPVVVDGELIGIVSAGVTTANVFSALGPRIPFVIALAIVVVVLGAITAALTRRSLRRMTAGLAPAELTRMMHFYESVLHSVREGVVLTDGAHRVVLYNDEAADLLGLPPAHSTLVPTTSAHLGIDPDVAALLDSGRRVIEETHVAGGRVLLVNQEPTVTVGGIARTGQNSAVMTLRDHSRLQTLVGELESERTATEALRTQAHEHSNTLHTIVSLVEMGRSAEVVSLVTNTSRTSQHLADDVLRAPAGSVLSALLLGKSASASERGIDLQIHIADKVALPLSAHETVSVVGNLVDNALEAVRVTDPARFVRVRLHQRGQDIFLEVSDSGRGPDYGLDVFAVGISTKTLEPLGHGVGLPLVRRIVTEHGGTVAFREGSPTTIVVSLPASVPGSAR